MSWPWRRRPVPRVTVRLEGGAKIVAPVDAIDWAKWFSVEREARMG